MIKAMEKVLFAVDELTGLIWAAALMRPSKSTKDMELREETGIESNTYLEQLYTMSRPDRDPRMRVIDIAYITLLRQVWKVK